MKDILDDSQLPEGFCWVVVGKYTKQAKRICDDLEREDLFSAEKIVSSPIGDAKKALRFPQEWEWDPKNNKFIPNINFY